MFRKAFSIITLSLLLSLTWSSSAFAELAVRVVAPNKTVFDQSVKEIILPSTSGQVGVLPGHAPMVIALESAVMRVRINKDWEAIALMGGIAEVENNQVTIVTDDAELGKNIDKAAAKKAYDTAEAALKKAENGDNLQARIKATQAFKKARARYQAAGGIPH